MWITNNNKDYYNTFQSGLGAKMPKEMVTYDIKNVKYTEGRFLPYFFPDTFHEGGDPVKEAKVNWVTARRAILRSPIQKNRLRRISETCPGIPGFCTVYQRSLRRVPHFI